MKPRGQVRHAHQLCQDLVTSDLDKRQQNGGDDSQNERYRGEMKGESTHKYLSDFQLQMGAGK